MPTLKHGHASRTHKTATYRVWSGMRERCLSTKCPKYKDYGGRGITICKRWLKFENFLADMGEKPAGLTLDRRNNDGPYCKRNCRWATVREQNNNRRVRTNYVRCNSRYLDGMLLRDYSRYHNISYAAAEKRYTRSIEK